ncbi:MAG TPA: hypothetical protein VHW60_22645 [Caulobacteraceae bacterium]|nr:hypothetical protein [Caulobacteraceae bacterium]
MPGRQHRHRATGAEWDHADRLPAPHRERAAARDPAPAARDRSAARPLAPALSIADHETIALPAELRVDAATACQLACPTCPTTEGKVGAALGTGFLTAANFARLLHQAGPGLRRVELSNFGEVFLNPELADIFRVAHERGVEVEINNGANLNFARAAALDALVTYRVRTLRCSIDGVTQAVYGAYRRGGRLARVLANIKRINALKAASGSPYPALVWQFIVFEHNQHELAEAQTAARVLGMRFEAKLAWREDQSPAAPSATVSEALGHSASRDGYLAETGDIYFGHLCEALWKKPQINFDGRMLGCCKNHWSDFGGNAFDDLAGALNSPAMRRARAMLQGETPPDDGVPCSTCEVYEERRRRSLWIEPGEAARGAYE